MKLLLYPDTTHPRYKISQIKAYIEYLGIELTDAYADAMRAVLEAGNSKYFKYLADCFYKMLKRHAS
jgi:hypothetical protein